MIFLSNWSGCKRSLPDWDVSSSQKDRLMCGILRCHKQTYSPVLDPRKRKTSRLPTRQKADACSIRETRASSLLRAEGKALASSLQSPIQYIWSSGDGRRKSMDSIQNQKGATTLRMFSREQVPLSKVKGLSNWRLGAEGHWGTSLLPLPGVRI